MGNLDRVCDDVGEFSRREPSMFLRSAERKKPGQQPCRAEKTCEQERPTPAPAGVNPGDSEWRQHCAHIRAGIEQTGRECSLLARKPFSNCLDRGREVARFSQT